ncbi:major facilitator superfamily transporter [Colletotrichum sublineola]|uniref:Putative major facilitator superfamily transporter n=1 Tax=Colletotrichum sublineola TaxID=1173701 RepID=A0A066X9V8_COLSU|nr:major facilitator superfamily transporter [Colletotrichum sublineola]KDN62536.1 putative major facilitator superfamily transporter [Colletotrichum sublineola]
MAKPFGDDAKVMGVVEKPTDSERGFAQSDSYGSSTGGKTFDQKLLYKLDLKLMVAMFFLNFLSLMGRTNVGAALIRQLPQDLKLDAMKVFIMLTMPAAPLILFEVPSNLLMRFLDRRFNFSYMRYMCLLDVLLGVITLSQGFVKGYDQILVTRFLVGVFDAGLIPGCVFLCSLYYPPTHLQWRLGLITVANICSSIVGNFLAYAIANIKTTDNFKGWRWIFIIEGIITVVASLLCSVANVGPPNKAKFLTEEEKNIIKNSVESRSTSIGALGEWKLFLTNPLNYCWAALYCFTTTTAYSVSIFSPSFVKSFRPGLDDTEVQAQVVPIFVVAAVACLSTAYIADRLNHRSAFGLVGLVFTIIGYAVLRNDKVESSNVTMMALYFIALGTFITLPMIWTLTMQNLQTPFQRAIGSGFVIGVGNVASYISAWIFRTSEGPFYRRGMTTGMILAIIAFGILSGTWLYIFMHNKRLDSDDTTHPSAMHGQRKLINRRRFRYKA